MAGSTVLVTINALMLNRASLEQNQAAKLAGNYLGRILSACLRLERALRGSAVPHVGDHWAICLLVWNYVRLARQEEREVLADFGEEYSSYMARFRR